MAVGLAVAIDLCHTHANDCTEDAVKENVQPFIWALEFVTFIVAIVVVWYVWSISKRASKRRKSQQGDV